MDFHFFDPEQEVFIREGNLPHWHQSGVTYFVTIRTEDSVPMELTRSWHARREEWLRIQGVDPHAADWKTHFERLPPEKQKVFQQTFNREFMEYLDRGLGACVLRQPEMARIVADSLLHFDGDRYLMGDFVVMPNHVHLLVCFLGDTALEQQCKSWKKFTAAKINRVLGKKGRFWQEESFDHLVRSPEHLLIFERYIAENPLKANLPPGAYLHYQRSK